MNKTQYPAMAAALLATLCVVALSTASARESTADRSWTSANGAFRVSYTSSLEPITINQIHHWTLRVETAEGTPVADADIQVEGGMPAHDHGLPTSPRLIQMQDDGNYRLEGLRFHMPGHWELILTINTGRISDTVLISLEL